MKTKILEEFQICISVPLKLKLIIPILKRIAFSEDV